MLANGKRRLIEQFDGVDDAGPAIARLGDAAGERCVDLDRRTRPGVKQTGAGGRADLEHRTAQYTEVTTVREGSIVKIILG